MTGSLNLQVLCHERESHDKRLSACTTPAPDAAQIFYFFLFLSPKLSNQIIQTFEHFITP